MACTPQHVSLPRECPECGGAVELDCQYATSRDTLIPAVYLCPHCQRQVQLALPGRVVSVAKRIVSA